MERGLLVPPPSWTREAAAAFGATEREIESTPSRSSSSSGCQSGWTHYLDHSNNGAPRYGLPCDPAAQRWMLLQAEREADQQQQQEDSMASDASSGPRPRRPRDDDDDERRGFEQQRHLRAGLFGRQSYSSGSVDHPSSGCCFGSSAWSRGSQAHGVNAAAAHVARRAAAVHGAEAAARQQYREIIVVDDEGDDELDDTASSIVCCFQQSGGHGAR